MTIKQESRNIIKRFLINSLSDEIKEKLILLLKEDFIRESIKICKKAFKDKKINAIEVGVMGGFNAKNILDNLNINKIFLVDPYISTKEYPLVNTYEEQAKELLKEYENEVKFIKMKSDDAINYLPKADFIYIDGSHEYEQVLKDMINYFPLIKKGGILAGHDIMEHQGVTNAVIKFCYENNIKPIFKGEDWIIRK